jgi:TatD DNase family protein
MICVGTNLESSKEAVEFAKSHDGIFASIGVHPHFAEKENPEFIVESVRAILHENGFAPRPQRVPTPIQTRAADVFLEESTHSPKNSDQKIVAIGEIGLDYYRSPSSHKSQIKIMQEQIELAQKYNLPMIFGQSWTIFTALTAYYTVLLIPRKTPTKV